MLGTLLIVLLTLALIHVMRTVMAGGPWRINPQRALSILVLILIMAAFAIGFIDL